MQPWAIGVLGVGGALALLYYMENPPWEWESERRARQRRPNLTMSPDWDEAWERMQQAEAYLLKGDKGHARLRVMEAMHHAQQLSAGQYRVAMEKIDDLIARIDG